MAALDRRGLRAVGAIRRASACASGDIAVVGDIGPRTEWARALTGARTVIHLAGIAHVPDSDAHAAQSRYAEVNTLGTLQLARASAVAGVGRLVFVSSTKVYTPLTNNATWHEDDSPNPTDDYGRSKLAAERGLREISAATGLEVVIVRPPLVYGPGARANFQRLVTCVAQGWPLPLGSIHNRRSLVSLMNLVDALILCATHPNAAGQIFNVADAQTVSTPELLRLLASALGVRARVVRMPVGLLRAAAAVLGRAADVNRLTEDHQVDTSRILDLLGWRAPQSLNEGLAEVARAYWGANRSALGQPRS